MPSHLKDMNNLRIYTEKRAGEGVRTLNIQLGRLTLCQLSYAREGDLSLSLKTPRFQAGSAAGAGLFHDAWMQVGLETPLDGILNRANQMDGPRSRSGGLLLRAQGHAPGAIALAALG